MNGWRPRLSFCCVLCSLWLWLELENPEVLLTATLDDTHTHAHRVRHHQPHNSSMEWEERVEIVREHFVKKGYRVHSGLQFGCELVLYADSPGRVHSDFCVHVVREGMCVCVCVVVVLVSSSSLRCVCVCVSYLTSFHVAFRFITLIVHGSWFLFLGVGVGVDVQPSVVFCSIRLCLSLYMCIGNRWMFGLASDPDSDSIHAGPPQDFDPCECISEGQWECG